MSRKPITAAAVPTPAANRERMQGMAKVAASFRSFRPAPEVVRRVEAIPTIFIDLDRVIGVGGLPTSRIIVVHGPSNKGKTALTLGLGLSFLRRDHFFGLCDAERTTPVEWLTDMYGEAFQHPGFTALEVGSYEQTRDGFRDYFETIAKARERGDIPPDTRALGLVDSIKKLVPKKLWDELQKAVKADSDDAPKKSRFGGKPKGGVDGLGGRAGQMKAAFNSAWMDELVPLLAQTRGTMILIARESVEEDSSVFGGETVRLTGGNALNFDASLRLRVNGYPMHVGEGESREYIGEKHTVDVLKTKVHSKDEAVPRAVFHSSNGAKSPAGFDRARDLLACALELGVVEIAGSSYRLYDGGAGFDTLAQGIDKTLIKLRDPGRAAQVETLCRARMVASVAA